MNTVTPERASATRAVLSVRDAAVADGTVERVRVECPVSVEGAEVVLARVGAVALTRCDLALESLHRTRNGLPAAPAAALLDAMVRDALVASAQAARPHDSEIDAVLADALVREEALRAMARDRPDDARIERYYREHLADLSRAERVRLRALALPSERAARETIRALSEGAAFEELLTRSLDPMARRDQGDLGWVTRETEGVAPGLVSAGFAIAHVGDVAPAPVAVTVRSTVRRRVRAVTTWYVVELTDRESAVAPTLDEVRRRIEHRLTRDRYLGLRREARERWRTALEPAVRAAIDERALSSVRVEGR